MTDLQIQDKLAVIEDRLGSLIDSDLERKAKAESAKIIEQQARQQDTMTLSRLKTMSIEDINKNWGDVSQFLAQTQTEGDF